MRHFISIKWNRAYTSFKGSSSKIKPDLVGFWALHHWSESCAHRTIWLMFLVDQLSHSHKKKFKNHPSLGVGVVSTDLKQLLQKNSDIMEPSSRATSSPKEHDLRGCFFMNWNMTYWSFSSRAPLPVNGGLTRTPCISHVNIYVKIWLLPSPSICHQIQFQRHIRQEKKQNIQFILFLVNI